MFKGADTPGPSNKRFFPKNLYDTQPYYTYFVTLSLIRIVCRRKSNNGNCQINPVIYVLDKKLLFTTTKLLKRVSKMIEILGSTMIFDQEKRKTTPFLFAYQNGGQKRFLARYGNELTLLDAAYHTARYAPSLFFLVVKTNINYR